MEARILASVLQTDTHKRLAAAEEISEFLKKEDNSLDEFAEMDRLVTGLAAWMGSSNFKASNGGRREGERKSEERETLARMCQGLCHTRVCVCELVQCIACGLALVY